jgi:simple sugar transport system ATP-binding protein
MRLPRESGHLHRKRKAQKKGLDNLAKRSRVFLLINCKRLRRSLTGGERQAISIGRAVAFERQMLILDELTLALSVKETEKIFQYICMAKMKGLVVLVIMHNLHQVAALADRFVVFWYGHKVTDFPNAEQSENELAEYISLGQPGKPSP